MADSSTRKAYVETLTTIRDIIEEHLDEIINLCVENDVGDKLFRYQLQYAVQESHRLGKMVLAGLAADGVK